MSWVPFFLCASVLYTYMYFPCIYIVYGVVMVMFVYLIRVPPEVGSRLVEAGFSRILAADQLKEAGLRLHLQLLECSELRVKQHLM